MEFQFAACNEPQQLDEPKSICIPIRDFAEKPFFSKKRNDGLGLGGDSNTAAGASKEQAQMK